MNRPIAIIDNEGQKRHLMKRYIIIIATMISIGIFSYPSFKEYSTKWESLTAARKLGLYLSAIKTRAILNKTAFEATFLAPDSIEIHEVSSCGPFSKKTKVGEAKLSDFEAAIEFPTEPWVRGNTGSKEPFLKRFCYDSLYGSSIVVDGLAHGSIFLAHHEDINSRKGDQAVQLTIEGGAGEMNIE